MGEKTFDYRLDPNDFPVGDQRSRAHANAPKPTRRHLSEAERRESVEFAIANVELEGGQVTDEFREAAEQVIDGTLTIDAFVALCRDS